MTGNKKAFTLIEVLVVVLVLAIVVGAGTGVFVSAVKIQKYNLKHEQVFSQISYIAEYMSRTIRMAVRDDDGVCISAGRNYEVSEYNTKIKFLNHKEQCQEFYLTMENGRGSVFSKTGSDSPILISSDNFNVYNLEFNVIGGSGSDEIQPRATMLIRMTSVGTGDRPNITIQTTVSQRNLDI